MLRVPLAEIEPSSVTDPEMVSVPAAEAEIEPLSVTDPVMEPLPLSLFVGRERAPLFLQPVMPVLE